GADGPGGEEHGDDAAASEQQGEGSEGEDDELPGLREGTGERDGGAEDRADRRRAGAGEEAAGARVAAQPLKPTAAEQDEGERGKESDQRGEQPAADPVG